VPVRPRTLLAGLTLLGVLASSCTSSSGAAAAPDGYQEVAHPAVRLAVPESWQTTDPGGAADRDDAAVAYAVPDAGGSQFGVTVWRSPGEGPNAAEDLLVQLTSPLSSAEGFEQLERDDDLEVPGSDEAALRRVAFVAPALEAPVRATLITAVADDGVVVIELVGTEEQIDDETLAAIVATIEVTGA
jgi:hypothetical protein